MNLLVVGVCVIATGSLQCSGRSFLMVDHSLEDTASAGGTGGSSDVANSTTNEDGATPTGGSDNSATVTPITTKSPDDDVTPVEPDVVALEPDVVAEPDMVEASTNSQTTACGMARGASSASLDSEVCIEGAFFQMGSETPPPNTADGLAAHAPVHDVMLSSFFLDAYEVTVGRYRACVDADACAVPSLDVGKGCTFQEFVGSTESLPMTCATWHQAMAFCNWDEERRLPTEAEWEFAARGAEGRRYAWGEEFGCERAVLSSNSLCTEYDAQRPSPVGSAPLGKSPEGVFDLTGNTSEWVADWIGSYSRTAQMDPTGPSAGGAKVIRGSTWLDAPGHAYAYLRRSAIADASAPVGFRCARDAEQ